MAAPPGDFPARRRRQGPGTGLSPLAMSLGLLLLTPGCGSGPDPGESTAPPLDPATIPPETGRDTSSRFDLEPGFWVLDAHGRPYDRSRGTLGEDRPLIQGLRVRVRLERGNDGDRVEILFAGQDEERGQRARAIRGHISRDPLAPGDRILEATGADASFELQLIGRVIDRRTVEGTILGLDPVHGDRGVQGKFQLRKL